MAEDFNLTTTLNGLVNIQEKTISTLSGKYYNKTSINEKVKVLSGLTDETLAGFNERLDDLQNILDNMQTNTAE